jgi:hypothetical protein
MADRLPFSEMLEIDVIEPLVPGLQAPLLQWDDLPAEAAPILGLAIPPDSVLDEMLFRDGAVFVLTMFIAQMSDVLLNAPEELSTLLMPFRA